jgi:hypothetical protein
MTIRRIDESLVGTPKAAEHAPTYDGMHICVDRLQFKLQQS